MDCPKFVPNIFYPSKCRQCYKCREDHRLGPSNQDTVDHDVPLGPSPDVLKCGHLFIAPLDYLPLDPHSKNKRWQRRWFILIQPGVLSYSIDDHPEAVPQGSIDLTLLEELRSGEEVTGHEHSFILKSTKTTIFLKGSSVDESRKWVRLMAKFVPNTLVDIFSSSIRRSSSSCASTTSNVTMDDRQNPMAQNDVHVSSPLSIAAKSQIEMTRKPKPLVRLRSYAPTYEKMSTSITAATIVESSIKKCVGTTVNVRGDPDGGEQVVTVDSGHAQSHPNGGLAASRPKWTSGSAGLKTGELSAKLESFKAQLSARKWDLEKHAKDSNVAKSDKVILENLKLQLNSYFIEIDKLSYAVNVKEGELKGQLKVKESEVAELESQLGQFGVLTAKNTLLEDENRLLVERINDLTEKFYGVEKNAKVLKSKLHRYRTNSLKDKDLELEVTSKVAQLESRLYQFLPQETPPPSPTAPLKPTNEKKAHPAPTNEKKTSLLGVIVKLNELEKRLEGSEVFNPTEWYKCGNCDFLQEEIQERDSKLNELEAMVNSLEATLNHMNAIRSKYQEEVADVQSLCADSLRSLDTAYNRLVGELEEKHCQEMTQFQIEKEQELEAETRATRNTLELLKRNYEMELANGIAEAREELLRKYRDKGISLEELHNQHEVETHALREKLNQLTTKYSEKCLETVQLQEVLIQRNVS